MERSKVGSVTVIFKSTCQCNINCQYCYDLPQRIKYKDLVVTKEIIDHTAKLASEYAANVNWTWHGGEATTLGKQFYIDAQETFYKHYGARFIQTLQSNGVLILDDYSWIEDLKEYDIQVGLSFDIYTQSIRLGSKYTTDEIMQKYIDLLNYTRKIEGHAQGAITVVHAKNIDKLIDMYEFMKKSVPNYCMCCNFVFKACGNESHDLGLTKEQYIEYFPKFMHHVVFDGEVGALYERSVITYVSQLLKHPYNNICHNSDCRKQWIGIQPNGEISYCDRELADRYYIGNILDYESLHDVYASEGYINMLEDINSRMVNYCMPCAYYNYCNGGCHSNHAIANDGLVDKCSETQCFEYQQNFITTLDVMQNIKLSSKLNRQILTVILESPSLVKCEIEHFLSERGICVDLTLDIEYLRNNPQELKNCKQFKLITLFSGDTQYYYDKKVLGSESNVLEHYLENRQEIFDNAFKTRQVEILKLVEEINK